MIKTKAQACIQWIQEYYKDNPDGKAIIGISGGKDSTIAAALCVEALGTNRVIGVLMPNGVQADIGDSREVCECLGIYSLEIIIKEAYEEVLNGMKIALKEKGWPRPDCGRFNDMIKTNLPARLRMATLYAVAALYPNSRVVNTCNRSEDYVGYSTKYGDAAGDFSPLGNLTVREVLEIGDELGLPEHLVHKTPSDGMCGKSDEDNLGFTYDELDNYILGTGEVSDETKEKIDRLHKSSRHKYQPMPMFDPEVLYVDSDQLSLFCDDIFTMTFDNSKQYKRGLRAESGIMDDYADGGLVDPSVMASAMAGNAIMTGLDIAEPAAANNVNINTDYKLADAIRSIENSMWQSMIKDGIRGIK